MAGDMQVGVRLRGDPSGAVNGVRVTRAELEKLAKQARTVKKDTDGLNSSFAAQAKQLFNLRNLVGGYLGMLGVTALTRFASEQYAAADALGKSAEVAGLTTDSLQELRHAFTSLGQVTDGQVDDALRRFNRRLGMARQEAGPAAKAFEQLFGGVSQFENAEQALDAVIDRLAAIEDPATRAGLASQFFGDTVGPQLAAAIGHGTDAIRQMRRDAHELGLVLDSDIIENAAQIRDDFDKTQRILNTAFMRALNEAAPLLISMANAVARIATGLTWGSTQQGKLYEQLQNTVAEIEKFQKMLDSGRATPGGPLLSPEALETIRGKVAELNDEAMRLSLAIDELNQKPPGGGGDPITVTIAGDPQGLQDLKLRIEEQQRLNAALAESRKAYQQVQQAIEREAAVRQFQTELVKSGITDTEEHVTAYEKEYAQLQKLKSAHEELSESQKRGQDFAKQLGMTFSSAFEDAIVEMEGLRDITNALLKDILRVIVRMQITTPLVNSIGKVDWGGLFGGVNADGNVFQRGNIIPFARGGVVTGPTLFPMAGNQTGLMGEAGPEAIMPLRRGPDGKLGVEAAGVGGSSTVVQIIDQRQGGEPPQVEESRGPHGQQLIRVLIRDEVQAAISGGAFDRTFANTYGLRRRGF